MLHPLLIDRVAVVVIIMELDDVEPASPLDM